MSGWENAPEYGGSKPSFWSVALTVLAVLAISAAIAWWSVSGAAAQTSTMAGIASVIDGDTIEIHGQRIRLSGIDAPERGSMCDDVNVYQRAAMALADLTRDRTVNCAVSGQDRYGRAVATCSVGSANLASSMTAAGWTRDWPRYSHGAYADEEAAARSAQAGIWGLRCPADLWGDRDYSPH